MQIRAELEGGKQEFLLAKIEKENVAEYAINITRETQIAL